MESNYSGVSRIDSSGYGLINLGARSKEERKGQN